MFVNGGFMCLMTSYDYECSMAIARCAAPFKRAQ